MARFSEYTVPDDHPAVLSGHISSGDKVPFLNVIENDRGVAGYAFTSGGIHWVEQYKSDDEVAAEEAETQAQRDKEAKQANVQAAQSAEEYKEENEPVSAASLRESNEESQ